MTDRMRVFAEASTIAAFCTLLAAGSAPLGAQGFEPVSVRVLERSDGFSLESSLPIDAAASLRIVGPSGEVFQQEFSAGEQIEFAPKEVLEDGSYRWEVIYREESPEPQRQGEPALSGAQWRAGGLLEVVGGAPIHVPLRRRTESAPLEPPNDPEGLRTKSSAATNHNTNSLSAAGNACLGDPLCTATYEPLEDLEVMDLFGDSLIRFLNENDFSPSIDWFVGTRNTGDFGIFEGGPAHRIFSLAGGAPTDSLSVSAAGFVGIGTSAPAAELHIQSASSSSELRMTPAAGSTWRWFNGTAGMWLQDVTSGTVPLQVSNTAPDHRLVIEGSGEIGIGTRLPSATVEIEGFSGTSQLLIDEQGADASVEVMFNLVCNCSPGFRMQNTTNGEVWFFRHTAAGDFSFDNVGGAGLEARLDPSGNFFLRGSLSQGSSRALKEKVEPANGAEVLNTLGKLDLYEWSYRGQSARHFGPMAEDFSGAYGLGDSSAKIAPSDMAGLALAAAKTLNERNAALLERVKRLETLLARLTESKEALGN